MTIEQLRVFLQDKFCGCGAPDKAAERLCWLLSLHEPGLFAHREELTQVLPDSGIEHLLLYMLHSWELTEHGGSVGGGWLTAKGADVLKALEAETETGFERVAVSYCIHGVAADDSCDECQQHQ